MSEPSPRHTGHSRREPQQRRCREPSWPPTRSTRASCTTNALNESETLRGFHPDIIAFLAVPTAGGGTQLGKPIRRPVRFKPGGSDIRGDFPSIEAFADRRLMAQISTDTGDPMRTVRAGGIAIMAVVLGLALAGCGSDEKKAEATASKKEDQLVGRAPPPRRSPSPTSPFPTTSSRTASPKRR